MKIEFQKSIGGLTFFCYLSDIIIVWINPWKYKNVDNTTVQCWVSDVKTKALTQTKNLFMAS